MISPVFDFDDILLGEIDSSEVFKDTFRLDSQYHILFDDKLKDIDLENYNTLEECCTEIYEVPPFKHIYVKKGIPFFTSADLFNDEFIPSHFLTEEMPKIDLYKIHKGQILMARSGNVEGGVLGQLIIVGDFLSETTTSDHVLRFTVNENIINIGYLKTFLESEFCIGQILKNASGAVIPAIRPDSLRELKVPRLKEDIETKISENALLAVSNRENAIKKLKRARQLVLEYNHLPPLDEVKPGTLDPDKETELQLVSTEEFTPDFRLDAHFYNPMAELAVRNIREKASETKYLYEISDCSYRGGRASRNYVDKEHGVPFLSGKNIIQIRPDLKYISKTETNNLEDILVEKNWILITRSGTLGRTVFIWNNYEKNAASEHLIRVIPFSDEVDEAYLYAFLSSDYGYQQLIRYKHGAVIDEITEDQISQSIIPIPNESQQKEIGDLVRQAYDLRAEAIRLEDEAQEILTEALTGKQS